MKTAAPDKIALDLVGLLGAGDVLLVVPPFSAWSFSSLACHLLQAVAREKGVTVRVLYANFVLAAMLGKDLYNRLGDNYRQLAGEKAFGRAAYGHRHQGARPDSIDPDTWAEVESIAETWTEVVARAVVQSQFKIVGCSNSFQQTSASVALLERIKSFDRQVITFVGGSNCEGEMAHGIDSLGTRIDYIFSGESEEVFPALMVKLLSGERPPEKIIEGSPCKNLDALPTPDFREYFAQLDHFLPGTVEAERVWLTYESSRGCWWGQKNHCTFCGLNGSGIQFREKSPERVLEELAIILGTSPVRSIATTDNIMPFKYFKTLLPQLKERLPDLHMHYEIKANLDLGKIVALKSAGVAEIQPGIEALSTPLLQLMRKGVSGPQNITLLRYCRAAGMVVKWNLLYGFPGDTAEVYEETLRILPYLRHLSPPACITPINIDRFSPYFDRASEYGLSNLRPLEGYSGTFPGGTDLMKLCYHFTADYTTAARPRDLVVAQLKATISDWLARYEAPTKPVLYMRQLSDTVFLVLDTRGLPGTRGAHLLDRAEAIAIAGGNGTRHFSAPIAWAIEQKLGLELDGQYVPLITSEPALLLELEHQYRKEH